MRDAARLYGEAEDAQVRSEMARSRLLVAKASLRMQTHRWSMAKTRLTTATGNAAGFRSTKREARHAH